jgi:alpha-glucosidase
VAHGLVKAAGLPDIGHSEQLSLLGSAPMPYFDQDGVHEIYREWRRILDEYPGDRIGVAEAWTPTIERAALYLRPDELHQAFNFEYLATPWDAAALHRVIDKSLDAMSAVGAPATWVLSNHDVTRHVTRLGNPSPALGGETPNGGTLQLREAGDRALGLRRARAATLLMLALPGSAYLYQGEELGLPDVTDLPDEVRQDPSFFRAAGQDGFRDGCRVPIPWSGTEPPYGFGPEGGGSWLPQPASWAELSVEAQTGDPASTLELYRAALALRRELPALGAGRSVQWLDSPDGVLAFRRDGAGDGFLCLVNLTAEPVALTVPGGRPLLSSAAQPPAAVPAAAGPSDQVDGIEVTIAADTAIWWAI